MRAGRKALWLAAVLVTISVSVLAEEAPPAVTPSDSVWQFGEREKLCVEWTDGCRKCRRAETDAISCSNIGIACQPKDIRCTVGETQK